MKHAYNFGCWNLTIILEESMNNLNNIRAAFAALVLLVVMASGGPARADENETIGTFTNCNTVTTSTGSTTTCLCIANSPSPGPGGLYNNCTQVGDHKNGDKCTCPVASDILD